MSLHQELEGWEMLVFYPQEKYTRVNFDFENGKFKDLEKDLKVGLEKVAYNPQGKHEFSSLVVAIPKNIKFFGVKELKKYDLREVLEIKNN